MKGTKTPPNGPNSMSQQRKPIYGSCTSYSNQNDQLVFTSLFQGKSVKLAF